MVSTSTIALVDPLPAVRRLAVLAIPAALAIAGIILVIVGLLLITGGGPARSRFSDISRLGGSYLEVQTTGSIGFEAPALRPSLPQE